MKKKIMVVLIICIMFLLGFIVWKTIKTKTSLELLSEINSSDISTIEIIRKTPLEKNEIVINNKENINDIYNRLTNIKVVKKAQVDCVNNEVIYYIYYEEKKLDIKFECNYLIDKNGTYEVKGEIINEKDF